MLKIATLEDLDLVTSMAVKFAKKTAYAKYVNEDKIRALATEFLTSNTSSKIVLLHGNEGMLAAMVNPILLGDALVASDVMWWVEENSRNKQIGKELKEAFEYWAKKIGATMTAMSCFDESVAKYYEKTGAKLLEYTYVKEL